MGIEKPPIGETSTFPCFGQVIYAPKPQTWEHLGSQGLVWGITAPALPLNPGDSRVLMVNDAYYWPDLSNAMWPLAAGVPIYAQVDSANALTTYGMVLETHEMTGGPYNNIRGTAVLSAVAGAKQLPANVSTAIPSGRPSLKR